MVSPSISDDKLKDYLTQHEVRKIEKEIRAYRMQYKWNWASVIMQTLRYQNPVVINADRKDLLEKNKEGLPAKVFVLPAFMHTGKQNFLISMQTPENGVKHYLSTKLIRHREEPVPLIVKRRRKVVKSKFDKTSSVFSTWRQDDDMVFSNCIKHDKMYWKLPNFIKKGELMAIEGVIDEHFEALKNCHTEMMCESDFPAAALENVCEFAKRANMFRHNWRLADLDRLFKATVTEKLREDKPGNDDNKLMRFEFIELMVRIAKDKYLDRNRADSLKDALVMLITRNIALGSRGDLWKDWRL